MLCFHGFGMHGKQFRELEPELGNKYTFWGFDLFFHKATKLKDQSLETVKTGLTKRELANLILDFCKVQNIDRFSVIGYSMGTHYATTIAEELPEWSAFTAHLSNLPLQSHFVNPFLLTCWAFIGLA